MISIIVAMTEDRVIGRDNQLPWHLSEDLVRFKKLTMGHPILMGRKTFESIGRPLPGRTNIVVSQNPSFKTEGVVVVNNFEEALNQAQTCAGADEIFVIGGSSLFRLALPRADRLYLTLVHHKISGDTYFPLFVLEKEFHVLEKSRQQSAKGERLMFSFITAEKRKAS